MSELRARPLTIAHRAGNSLSTLAKAFAAGVDYAEADVWLYRGRLEVRHEKTAGPLPVLWDRWYLKSASGPRLALGDLLAVSGRGKLLLDLKGRDAELPGSVVAAVRRANAAEHVAFTGVWSHLDRVGDLLPAAACFYSVGSPRRLDALRPRLARREIACVSIDSRFVTEEIVSELRAAGMETIITWAVKTLDDARRVLRWGVDGVTSESLSLLVAVRDAHR